MTTTDQIRPNDSSLPTTHEIVLEGCSPTPLAHYLKALAVLRLVSEQVDPNARGSWRDDDFVLQTRMSTDELVEFFAQEYRPTPLVAPWNGGSGFKLGNPKDTIAAVIGAEAERMQDYALVDRLAFEIMEDLGVDTKVPKSLKEDYLEACRARFPDRALDWLDAAVVLTGEGPKYPPVLGTGGNDGRLDFTLNFQQRLRDLFDFDTGRPHHLCEAWLRASLFDTADSHLESGSAIGQFFPGAAGGTNQTVGFDAKTIMNPWDFVLMLEGAIMFAAASVKRLESAGSASMSAPFCVRHTGVGHGSADLSEEGDARPEMWMPLWRRPASSAQIGALLHEGRAQVGRRSAANGLDFARAVGQLGVDRGIDEFVRYGFQMRNGRAYFATPLGRLAVERRPQVDLIDELDDWLATLRRVARDDSTPASITSKIRELEEALFALCHVSNPTRLANALVSIGACERAAARRPKWARGKGIRPLRDLSERWLEQAYDGTVEFRLAASLAALGGNSSLRPFLEPVQHARAGIFEAEAPTDVVWHDGDPVDAFNAVMQRRLLHVQRSDTASWTDWSELPARLEDVAAFIAGRVDLQRMARLLWGLMAIDFDDAPDAPFEDGDDQTALPDALYGLMKLCFAGKSLMAGQQAVSIPAVPAIHRHAADGDGLRASVLAARRLRGSGFSARVDKVRVRGKPAERAAAALLFPLAARDVWKLQRRLIDDDE